MRKRKEYPALSSGLQDVYHKLQSQLESGSDTDKKMADLLIEDVQQNYRLREGMHETRKANLISGTVLFLAILAYNFYRESNLPLILASPFYLWYAISGAKILLDTEYKEWYRRVNTRAFLLGINAKGNAFYSAVDSINSIPSELNTQPLDEDDDIEEEDDDDEEPIDQLLRIVREDLQENRNLPHDRKRREIIEQDQHIKRLRS